MKEHFDDWLPKVLEVLPLAEVGQENDGQLVVYTNLTMDEDGYVSEVDDNG